MTETIPMPLQQPPAYDARPEVPRRTWWERLLRDTGYCLTALPIAVPAFVLVVTGLSVGLSLALFAVGLPVLVLTAYVARGFAHLERQRVRAVLERHVPLPTYAVPRAGDSLVRRTLVPLRDPQSWFDQAWALAGFVTSVVATSVALTWWATILGGFTYPFWQRFLPDSADSDTLAEILGFGSGRTAESWLNVSIAAVALVTLVPVMRLTTRLHASLGAVLLGSRAELQQEMSRLVRGRDAARVAEAGSLRRLERDIHDGPQQRLVRLSLDIARAQRQVGQDPAAAQRILDSALSQARETVDELRSLSRGIAPPVLVDRGLAAALDEVVARSPVPVRSRVEPDGPLPAHVETAVYFLVSEALTNVAKHAEASEVDLVVERAGAAGDVRVWVADDGRGGAHPAKGHGLAGLEQRVRAVDGTLVVRSPAGGPTTVEARIPVR